MRDDPAVFRAQNEAPQRSPRFFVVIDFGGGDVIRLASHDDIPSLPGGTIENVLSSVGGVSQQIQPDEARATIGSFTFSAIDAGGVITDALRSMLIDNERGLRGKQVRFLAGYAGMDFGDFQLLQTQRVSDCTFRDGTYNVTCSDIQRELRSEIFDLAQTALTESITPATTSIPVDDTTDFVRVKHGPSYSDAPNVTVGYIELSSGEIVRYTGKNATHFTGCTRGLFATEAQAIEVTPGDPFDQRPSVTEFVYLELPAIKIAWALLTGELFGSADTIPDGWHLGIDPDDLVEDDFTGIGLDLWDPDDDEAGFVAKFTHLSAEDGKRFLEREVYLLSGVYSPVNSAGQLGLRRMTAVIADAAYVATLDDSCIVSVDGLHHDMPSLHNQFLVSWNWTGEDFTRQDLYIDANSVNLHGIAPLMELPFRGLAASRHTTEIIQGVIDRIRDRYANPPLRMRLSLLGSRNRIETGDIVRVEGARIRDYSSPLTGELQRSLEVQQVSYDWIRGLVTVELLGSAGSGAPTQSPLDPILDDAKYTSVGTDLDSVLDIVAGVVQPGTYDLTGHANMNNAAARYFFDGDLEVGVGATITINDNVQFRIKGFFDVQGTISGLGRGKAGTSTDFGVQGYVGSTHGAWGLVFEGADGDFVSTYYGQAKLAAGLNASFPPIEIQLNDSDDVGGIPTDLRGTSGGRGGDLATQLSYPNGAITSFSAGGDGATSGAGFCVVCRGMNVDGVINLSGDNSDATTAVEVDYSLGSSFASPGAGGSGGPGAFLVVLDGGGSVAPFLTAGHLVGATGSIPLGGITLSEVQHQSVDALVQDHGVAPNSGHRDGSVLSSVDMSGAIFRVTYLQENPDAVDESVDSAGNVFKPYPYPAGYVLTCVPSAPGRAAWRAPAGGSDFDGGNFVPTFADGGFVGADGGMF